MESHEEDNLLITNIRFDLLFNTSYQLQFNKNHLNLGCLSGQEDGASKGNLLLKTLW